jgi:hypothetical protein
MPLEIDSGRKLFLGIRPYLKFSFKDVLLKIFQIVIWKISFIGKRTQDYQKSLAFEKWCFKNYGSLQLSEVTWAISMLMTAAFSSTQMFFCIIWGWRGDVWACAGCWSVTIGSGWRCDAYQRRWLERRWSRWRCDALLCR